MDTVTYRIVEHDGGWAYKLGDVFSETFPTRRAAETAADRVAAEQAVPDEDETIEWQDESGRWHEEVARGSDRPRATVASPTPRPAMPRSKPPRSADEPPTRARASVPVTHLLLAGTAGALIAVLAVTKRRS